MSILSKDVFTLKINSTAEEPYPYLFVWGRLYIFREKERGREGEKEDQDYSVILWVTLDDPCPGNTSNTYC